MILKLRCENSSIVSILIVCNFLITSNCQVEAIVLMLFLYENLELSSQNDKEIYVLITYIVFGVDNYECRPLLLVHP